MLETLSVLPVAFWVVATLLFLGSVSAWGRLRDGTGLPTLAVLITTAVWYVGDALYNGYSTYHAQTFTPKILEEAWWQVAWFLGAFLVLVPVFHRSINARFLRLSGRVFHMFQLGVGHPDFQRQLNRLLYGCLAVWLVLAGCAWLRLGAEIPYYFFPFLGYKADPWGRGRVGAGIDALLSFANYFQIFVAAAFGVVAALSQNRWIRSLALLGCLLTWPYYIFDRTRNTLLSATVPGVLAWVFLRFRGGFALKAVVLFGCFLLIEAWMSFIIANRSDMAIGYAFKQRGSVVRDEEEGRHLGLNMYEELCWINTFMAEGNYQPNWGQRYFAELVNPVPRSLWPGKPFIGIDYSILRGQGGGEVEQAGVYATTSTGMIGQGVVNFGQVFGPPFAALLLAIWVAMLARLDLLGYELGRTSLYALGLILTFNLGRDITLLTFYPFVFGSLLVWWLGRLRPTRRRQARPRQVAKPLPSSECATRGLSSEVTTTGRARVTGLDALSTKQPSEP